MKRIMSCLLAVMMLMSLTACDLDSAPVKEPGTSQSVSGGEEETFALNDTAVFKTLKFTATEMKETAGDTYFTPASGNVFVGVKFTIENVSDAEQTVSSLMMFEAYTDDVKSQYSFSAVCAFGSETLDGNIAPGKKLEGWYAIEVPENWEIIELSVHPDVMGNSTATFVFNK